MLLAGKPFFFRRGKHHAIFYKASRRIVVDGVDSQGNHRSISLRLYG
jgi:hypothetical protein